MTTFATYSGASIKALEHNPKFNEVIDRKREILKSVSRHENFSPKSYLFVGFSGLILTVDKADVYVTSVDKSIRTKLDEFGVKYTYIDFDDLQNQKQKFDYVIAVDEFFTFANSEDHQRGLIEKLGAVTGHSLVTSLRDYKNQDYKDKEFSHPLTIRNDGDNKIFLEHHDYDYVDRNSWQTTVYEIHGDSLTTYGSFKRRTMFFKQLAKFSADAGSKKFYVHKNLMYKSLIKKNYEHLISITF